MDGDSTFELLAVLDAWEPRTGDLEDQNDDTTVHTTDLLIGLASGN